jgi:hypothetical protein
LAFGWPAALFELSALLWPLSVALLTAGAGSGDGEKLGALALDELLWLSVPLEAFWSPALPLPALCDVSGVAVAVSAAGVLCVVEPASVAGASELVVV